MTTPTLVVMAAGASTRYGHDKQVEGVGPAGERLLEYSVFDAWRAGFGHIVFVIRPDLGPAFAALARHLPRNLRVTSVDQGRSGAPPRSKPWGTVAAVLAARAAVEGPFTVLNADDFYGAGTLRLSAEACAEAATDGTGAVIAFEMAATASDHGPVTRAVLDVEGEWLTRVREVRGVTRANAVAGTLVSMNCWTFPASVVARLADQFAAFVQAHAASADAELALPDGVNVLIAAGQVRVRVRPAIDAWCGLTHGDDRALVSDRLRALVAAGDYPSPLW